MAPYLNPQSFLDLSLALPELEGDPDDWEDDGHEGKEVGKQDHEEPAGPTGSG